MAYGSVEPSRASRALLNCESSSRVRPHPLPTFESYARSSHFRSTSTSSRLHRDVFPRLLSSLLRRIRLPDGIPRSIPFMPALSLLEYSPLALARPRNTPVVLLQSSVSPRQSHLHPAIFMERRARSKPESADSGRGWSRDRNRERRDAR